MGAVGGCRPRYVILLLLYSFTPAVSGVCVISRIQFNALLQLYRRAMRRNSGRNSVYIMSVCLSVRGRVSDDEKNMSTGPSLSVRKNNASIVLCRPCTVSSYYLRGFESHFAQ